MPTAGSARLQ